MRMNVLFRGIMAICTLVSVADTAISAERPTTQPATRPATIKITVSKETTYITEPLNANGTVNYVGYLNALMSRGVTTENNAAILLLRAAGPKVIDESVRQETFRLLQMEPLPADGEYFIPLEHYVRAHAPADKLTPRTQPFPPELEGMRDQLSPDQLKTFISLPSEAEEEAQNDFFKAMEGPWSAKDMPTIAAWLKANAGPLALVTTAVKRPRYYMPLVSDSDPPQMIDSCLPKLGHYRTFGKALTARAMLKVNSGDVEGAFADLMTCHRLAGVVGQDLTLISRLVGMAIESLACGAETKLAHSGKLSPEQAKAYLGRLQALPPLPDVVESIDKAERMMCLDCTVILARGGAAALSEIIGDTASKGRTRPQRSVWGAKQPDWDQVLRKWNYWFDKQVAAHKADSAAKRKELFGQIDRELNKRTANIVDNPAKYALKEFLKGTFFSPSLVRKKLTQAVSDLLVSILMPSLRQASAIYDRTVMKSRLAKVALALAACKAEQGQYPAELSPLAPEYLKEIPKDIFSDGELKYRRDGEGYILYSVGDNMIDDGGKDAKAAEGDDLVVEVK